MDNLLRSLLFGLILPFQLSWAQECFTENAIMAHSKGFKAGISVPFIGYVSPGHYDYYGDNIPWDDLKKFSFAKEFEKDNISEIANNLADELAEDIEEKKKSPRNSNPRYTNISHPSQSEWIKDIAFGSRDVVSTIDQLNIFFNNGNISKYDDWDFRKSDLGLIAELTKDFGIIEYAVYKQLPFFLHFARMQKLPKQFILNEASCLYGKIVKISENNSLFKSFTDQVPEVRFMVYIEDLYNALESAVNSDKTEHVIQSVYEQIMKKIRNEFDINEITAAAYLSFTSVRSVLLRIDIEEEVKNLEELINMFEDAMHKTMRGQWPEMAKFLDNFIRLTFGTKDMWVKLDTYYQRAIMEWEARREFRLKELERYLDYRVLPFFRNIIPVLEGVAQGSPTITDYIDRNLSISAYSRTWAHYLRDIDGWFHRLNRNVCSVRWFATEDYDAAKSEFTNNDFIRYLNDLCFQNWPKDEVYPKSFDDFFEKLFRVSIFLSKSITKACIW